jgi:hypothetical protein
MTQCRVVSLHFKCVRDLLPSKARSAQPLRNSLSCIDAIVGLVISRLQIKQASFRDNFSLPFATPRHVPLLLTPPMTLLLSIHSVATPLFLASLAIYFLRQLTWKKEPSVQSPPGPRPLPLIGNMHQIPRTKPHLTWNEWGKVMPA